MLTDQPGPYALDFQTDASYHEATHSPGDLRTLEEHVHGTG
jgi:hypothetical protein